MRTFSDYSKGIAYLLLLIMLLQSCIVYRKHPSSIEEATAKKNTRIKLTTKDSIEYKLRWVDEQDGYVYSIKNTKRIYVDKQNLSTYPIKQYRFIKTQEQGDYIVGITMTRKDTATVLVPIDQIEEIKLISQDKTIGVPILIFGLFIFAGPWIIFGVMLLFA